MAVANVQAHIKQNFTDIFIDVLWNICQQTCGENVGKRECDHCALQISSQSFTHSY